MIGNSIFIVIIVIYNVNHNNYIYIKKIYNWSKMIINIPLNYSNCDYISSQDTIW